MSEGPEYAVFCGIDVGKGAHHAVALDVAGKRLQDKELPQDEAALRAMFERLLAHCPVLVVVDQPNNIGALAIAVARDSGCQVAYLPGFAMRRIADLHPGQAKTDARDAYVIPEAARSMPHTLRRVDVGEAALAELDVLVGFDDDLPPRPPDWSTASAAGSAAFTQPWKGFCAHESSRPGSWPCSSPSAAPSVCGPRDAANCFRSRPRPRPGSTRRSSTTCSPHSMSRPWSSGAPTPPSRFSRAWPARWSRYWISARPSAPRSRRSSIPTLLPAS